ncbi:MAG: DbpA RNA binding domain-containing protein [Treponema sp.]|jgi:RNA recognition motif-containing protein|nr:DbpA RNA binding domain-containing protein [Treponema sp.]
MSPRIDKKKTKETLTLILDKIRTEADPLLLDEYHRLFKKEVSLFHRSKAAAYLLMLCDQGKNLRFAGRSGFIQRSNFVRKEEDTPRYPLAEEESKRLFFSVGRSRRVFPREILGLINTKTAIPREDIGAIRILDNYSFVQVRDTVAEKVIEALNGTIFRGRPLTVNYAKSRKDEENNAVEDEEEIYSEDDSSNDNSSDNYSVS